MKSLISLSILSACLVACQPSKAPEQEQTPSATAIDTTMLDTTVVAVQDYESPPPEPPKAKYLEFVAPTLKVDEMPKEEHMDIHTEGTQGLIGTAAIEAENMIIEPDYQYTNVDQKPEFNPKGGLETYIKDNLNYPEEAMDEGFEGITQITFVVTKDGQVTQARISKSSGNREMDYEALRVIKKMPRWIPGKQNGQTVSVMLNIPIVFELGE